MHDIIDSFTNEKPKMRKRVETAISDIKKMFTKLYMLQH
jgi:hypothetical protein